MSDMQLNRKKGQLFNEKIAKNTTTFRKNKPNSPIVQTDVTSFTTMNYTIFTSLTKVKNKPNQTQFKPNTKPITERPIMNISTYFTSKYINETALRWRQNKPKQTQSPNAGPAGRIIFLS